MIGYARARGLVWSVPGALLTVAAAAWFGSWLAARPSFHSVDARVPAVVLGALLAGVCVVAGLHRNDDEIDGSTPRPGRVVELTVALVVGMAAAALAIVLLSHRPLQRGGLELVRDLVGLTGLALVGGALLGSRLAWALPFAWASVSYLSVTREYERASQWAAPGWLMFPATWTVTWVVAGLLLVLGCLVQYWAGGIPRQRRHPLR